MVKLVSFAAALAMLAGCGGSSPKQANTSDDFGSSSEGSSSSGSSGSEATVPENKDDPLAAKKDEFDEKSAQVVIERGKRKAINCSEVVPEGPRGEAEVQVVFDGAKGRVVDATVGAPFEGTDIGKCVARAFIGEIVPPFDGENKTMTVKVDVPKADKKKK